MEVSSGDRRLGWNRLMGLFDSVLITGGSGFLAKGLVPAMFERGAKRICLASRAEHAQAQMRAEFNYDTRLRPFIRDVRDYDGLRSAMQGVRVVIHAAALKRVEVCQYNPIEAIKTNVEGSKNVALAATDAGVERVVFVSTDKAYNPVNTYGATKFAAESMFIALDSAMGTYGPRFAAVRYGNVWNSTGSIVPRWREALKKSGEVPVTDPDCTRFFMTRGEAVELVLRTAETMEGGELNIPDLPAYRVGDLAEAMGAKMRIIGLPKEEKLHEGMADGNTSDLARRMTVDELREALKWAI